MLVVGRSSDSDDLFDPAIATFEDDRGAYDQKDAEGFIRLNALRLAHGGATRKGFRTLGSLTETGDENPPGSESRPPARQLHARARRPSSEPSCRRRKDSKRFATTPPELTPATTNRLSWDVSAERRPVRHREHLRVTVSGCPRKGINSRPARHRPLAFPRAWGTPLTVLVPGSSRPALRTRRRAEREAAPALRELEVPQEAHAEQYVVADEALAHAPAHVRDRERPDAHLVQSDQVARDGVARGPDLDLRALPEVQPFCECRWYRDISVAPGVEQELDFDFR